MTRSSGQAATAPLELAGRVAIVTGGGSGIGRATALLLAERGARVFVGDIHARVDDDGQFARLGITQLPCDVRRAADVARLIDTAVEAAGRLHIVVSNAGVNCPGQVPDVSEAAWDECLDTNLKGAFLCAKFAIPHLRQAGGGAIVHTASNAGLLPRAHDPVYSTSKGALVAFTRALALAHAGDRIRVNAVCPGPVTDTGMMAADLASAEDAQAAAAQFIQASPLARAWGRMITPAEVAAAIAYLVSDAAAMVTGTLLAIDGGKSLGVPPASTRCDN
ncbi:MAG: SDR family oxidoreductase [Pirellulales bacterium]|nr:SDR family oxidoreductase [Pirellulales bacterium]